MNWMQTHRQHLIGAFIVGASAAANAQVPPPVLKAPLQAAQAVVRTPMSGDAAESAVKARQVVTDAVQVVGRLKQENRTAELLQRAKGIFIVPAYGRVSLASSGGQGVLLTRADGGAWSNPVFHTLTGVSVGAGTGGADGPVALLLMSRRAVDTFRTNSDFSLGREVDLTIVNIARRSGAADRSAPDVVVWSGAGGPFAGVSVGATDVRLDRTATNAYYGLAAADSVQVLDGTVTNPNANALGMVLSR